VKRRPIQTGLVLLLLLVPAAVLVPASTGASSRPAKPPLAGPWYTPQELQALIRYSNASFAERQRILAGDTTVKRSHHA